MADRSENAATWRGPSPLMSWLVGVLAWCALTRPALAELAAGALVVALVGVAVARACPIRRADFAPWWAVAAAALRRGPGLVWQIATGSATLLRAAVRPGRIEGGVQERAFAASGAGRVAPSAVLAAQVAAGNLSPSTVVLGLDPQHTALRIHVLPGTGKAHD